MVSVVQVIPYEDFQITHNQRRGNLLRRRGVVIANAMTMPRHLSD